MTVNNEVNLEYSDYCDTYLLNNGYNLTNIIRDKGNTWRGEISYNDDNKRLLFNQIGKCLSNNDNYDISIQNFWDVVNKRFMSNADKLLNINKDVVKPRQVIQWFSEKKEVKLSANDYKGSWCSYTPEWLFERLLKEMSELYNAMLRYNNKDNYEKIIYESADISNFAMFIADVINRKYNDKKNIN